MDCCTLSDVRCKLDVALFVLVVSVDVSVEGGTKALLGMRRELIAACQIVPGKR